MSNPVLNNNFLTEERTVDGQLMTVNGTIQVAVFLGLLMVASSAFVWSRFNAGYLDLANICTTGGAIAGLILGLIISFTRNKILIPIYAVAEGLFIGGLSAMFEKVYPGIVIQAISGTFGALFAMLALYRMGLIRATDKFRSVIFISTASIFVVYLVDFIGHFFNMHVPLINSVSPLGIGISVLICIIASLNLIIDFDFIEKGEQMMLPKDYEWYGAFGLLVTIVWLYVEILKLLSKINKK